MSRNNPRRYRELTPEEHRQVKAWLAAGDAERDDDRRHAAELPIRIARLALERRAGRRAP